MNPMDFLEAARVPDYLKQQKFGLWTITRPKVRRRPHSEPIYVSFPSAILWHQTGEKTDRIHGDVVMEDSFNELARHMPIWLAARGRVLITGLGLGCVVRGLLANPDVDHIDVVEKDAGILRVIGPEFTDHPKVSLHHGDALTFEFPPDVNWDYAWHDLWVDGTGLQGFHIQLFTLYAERVYRQGAWMLPRWVPRLCRAFPILGSKKAYWLRATRAEAVETGPMSKIQREMADEVEVEEATA